MTRSASCIEAGGTAARWACDDGSTRTLPLDIVVRQILDAELGEPPGLLVEGVAPDSSGITWWHGEPPGWWRRPGAAEA